MNEIVQKIVRPSALQLGMILGLLLALLFIFLDPGAKADSEINTTAENVAIEGYDTVAYFTQKKAVTELGGSPTGMPMALTRRLMSS